MNSKIKSLIIKILEGNNLMFLSTVNSSGNPESCSVYYVFDKELNIYFWTDLNSRHSKNIIKNKHVAISIAETSQKWGSLLLGLQIEGKCKKVSKFDILKPALLYLRRYPKVKKLISHPSEFLSKFDSSIFKIKPKWIKILDEKAFGKEVWKEVSL